MPKSSTTRSAAPKPRDAIGSRLCAGRRGLARGGKNSEDDLAGAEERLRMFLEQYWGRPTNLLSSGGPPPIASAHACSRISLIERDAWLRCMHTARPPRLRNAR